MEDRFLTRASLWRHEPRCCRRETHAHAHASLDSFDDPHQPSGCIQGDEIVIRSSWRAPDRHKVGQRNSAALGGEGCAEDIRGGQIRSFGSDATFRTDLKKTASVSIEDAPEHGSGIETPETAPIDAAIPSHKRRSMTVT
uniref:hypothetical protein n=1 Tax=Pseudomonas sp. K-62 TaxID=76885 RepID=UPI00159EDB63|nr:hypothetical protein [Pseudomonas sp. K-62]